MAKRLPDKIRIEADSVAFDRFESLDVVHDLTGHSEASFDLGDDGAWEVLSEIIAPGQPFSVFVNDRLQMTGRADVNESTGSGSGGVGVSLVCRTKLADARYASADPATRIEKTSIRDFILALYAPQGFLVSDFVFESASARELMTGKAVGAADPVDLEPIKLEAAKVQPGETIFACAERHLKRHHMTHWDAPDGRILVGMPDDEQSPIYRAIGRRGAAAQGNNLLGWKRGRDWSEVASKVTVYGQTSGKDIAKAKVIGITTDVETEDVTAATGNFLRPVHLLADDVKTADAALARSQREWSARARRKDTWELTFDGWSYWTGDEAIPFAHNTTIDVDVETVAARSRGVYLVHKLRMKLGSKSAPTTTLEAVAKGIWVI